MTVFMNQQGTSTPPTFVFYLGDKTLHPLEPLKKENSLLSVFETRQANGLIPKLVSMSSPSRNL